DVCRAVNLYNALYGWDDDSQVVPLLAESFEANDDSTVWTCTLKQGIKFSDGSPITPEDDIFTFERITDPDDPKTAAANFTMLDKDVSNGERTVEFRLTEPNGLFNDAVAEYTAAIVPAGYDTENPVCSGPFKLKSATPAQS